MFQEQLQRFGLTKTQSKVLDYLFEFGESKARDIAKNIRQPRGVIYKATEELLMLNLIEKIEKNKEIARFRANHPRKIEKVLRAKEVEVNENKKIFEEVLPNLISNYNLTLNKPGVKFYEGKEGMEKILEDTLTSKTEILLFINTNSLAEEEKFKKINDSYVKKRLRKNIKKRIIEVGKKPKNIPPEEKNTNYQSITEIRYLENNQNPFKSDIQIYDNKISYQILEDLNIISILVEDKNIYEMNRAWFEILWEIAKP